MAKAIGILLMVVAIWVAGEVFTKGTHGAFGGALSRFSSAPPPTEEHRWAGERAGSSVGNAHESAEQRRNRMLGE